MSAKTRNFDTALVTQLSRLKSAPLNAEIDELRLARGSMSPDEYQAALLSMMLELAATEEDIETRETELGVTEEGDER